MDIERLRRETPGCANVVHLNNAGAGLMPTPVLGAIQEHLELEATIGGYEAADLRAEAIEASRAAVARMVGAEAGSIAFMENATAAFNAVLTAIPFERGDVLLTSRVDYTSNQIAYLSLADRFGVDVVRAPDLPEGGVDPRAAEAIIHRRRPRLVAMTQVPTNSGLVQQLAPIGRACRDRNVPFLVDACQSVGQLAIDVQELQCDFLSATARKYLRGPRGAGFLYVSQDALDAGYEPLTIDMRGADWVAEDLYQPVPDARRFENWENAYALVLGLGAAARYAEELGMDAIEATVKFVAEDARSRLAQIDGVRVLDRGSERCGLVTIDVQGRRPSQVVRALRDAGVNTSASLREYAVLDFSDKDVEGAVRISPHYYNTADELEAAAAVIGDLVS